MTEYIAILIIERAGDITTSLRDVPVPAGSFILPINRIDPVAFSRIAKINGRR
jgi:hypothetical protein